MLSMVFQTLTADAPRRLKVYGVPEEELQIYMAQEKGFGDKAVIENEPLEEYRWKSREIAATE